MSGYQDDVLRVVQTLIAAQVVCRSSPFHVRGRPPRGQTAALSGGRLHSEQTGMLMPPLEAATGAEVRLHRVERAPHRPRDRERACHRRRAVVWTARRPRHSPGDSPRFAGFRRGRWCARVGPKLHDMRTSILAIVEAAYRLDGDEYGWLSRVTHASLALLDNGLGLISFFYDMRRASADWLDEPIAANIDARTAHSVRMVHQQRSARARQRPYQQRQAVLQTSSQLYASSRAAGTYRDIGARVASRFGVADFLRINIRPTTTYGCVLGVPLKKVSHVDRRTNKLWTGLAKHLAAGLRLRRAFAPADAIFDSDGRIQHAASGMTRDSLDALRQAAVTIDRARSTQPGRANREVDLWPALVRGRWSLVDRFDSDGRRLWIAHRNPVGGEDPRGLTEREHQAADLVALGYANKQIAADLGVADGTVAALVASVRAKVGGGSRADLIAALSVPGAPRLSVLNRGREALTVLSQAVRTPRRFAALTASEWEIAAAVARGSSNAKIAQSRGTSIFTVINQLQTVYRKLGVESRAELARLLHA